jgi:hypothetical protein
MDRTHRFTGALIGAIAALGVVGAGWAYAQEAPTTTTPPTTTAPSQDGTGGSTTQPDRHCDHDGGAGATTDTAPTSATDL